MTTLARADDVQRRNQTEREREHQLDADLWRAFFGALAPLGARGRGVRAQRLGDAGAEPIGLRQHRHQRPHVVDLRAFRQSLERLEPRLAGADLVGHGAQLLRQRRQRDLELFARRA